MPSLDTRKSLIFRLKDPSNERAWREFVTSYEGFLKRLVRRHGVPERHLADVTQQILMSIAQSIDTWRDDGQAASFRRWLGGVSRNTVLRFLSKERHQPSVIGGSQFLSKLEFVGATPDQQSEKQYLYELIIWAADQVRHEFRESSWNAFQATVIDHRPVDEVARELGLSPGSIYMSRSRILARIRHKVTELSDAPLGGIADCPSSADQG